MKLPFARALGFARRALRDFFFADNGMLLTGAVAYNAMLSLVPLAADLQRNIHADVPWYHDLGDEVVPWWFAGQDHSSGGLSARMSSIAPAAITPKLAVTWVAVP